MAEVKIEESWKKHLAEEFEKPYFKELTDFVKKEYQARFQKSEYDVKCDLLSLCG